MLNTIKKVIIGAGAIIVVLYALVLITAWL
jgi:hypothetical protein